MIPTSRHEAAFASWTLLAPDGASFRIAGGLVIGEDEEGRFEVSPPEHTALVRFEVKSRAVHVRLLSRDWALARNDRVVGDSLRCERSTEIHLPNNVIRIVGGSNPTEDPERIELTRRVSMKWLLPTPHDNGAGPAHAAPIPAAGGSKEIAQSLSGRFPTTPPEVSPSAPPPEQRNDRRDDSESAVPDQVAREAPHEAAREVPKEAAREAPVQAEREAPVQEIPVQVAREASVPAVREDRRPEASIALGSAAVRTQPSRAHRRRGLSPVMAALVGVGGGIGIALFYQGLSDQSPPVAGDPVAVAVPALALPSTVAENTQAVAEPARDVAADVAAKVEVETTPAPAPAPAPAVEPVEQVVSASNVPIEVPPPVEEARLPVAVADREPERRAESREEAAQVEEPVREPVRESVREPVQEAARPPVQETAVAAVARTPQPVVAAAQVNAAAAPPAVEKPADRPAPAVTAQRQSAPPAREVKADEADRALAEQETRRRLLLAADVALKQGRLTSPPESSAYAFYRRILELDPGSAEATAGLNAVRQTLINRTLAQLAANSLDEASTSLEAAEQAEVNPQLIVDLRGEVDYRKRLSDARAGRFESLYPADQLVAVSRQPVRVPGATGAESFADVQFTVAADGTVRDVEVINDLPDALERAVRSTVEEWRFEPVLYNGRPLPVRSSVRLDLRQ